MFLQMCLYSPLRSCVRNALAIPVSPGAPGYVPVCSLTWGKEHYGQKQQLIRKNKKMQVEPGIEGFA